jgi:hypothetical protein
MCSIRGNMQPHERAANMDEFCRGASRLLITTDAWRRVITSDVWSGGIDFRRVKVVINYDLPSCCELYVERFGTSSRFDSRRVVISLVTDEAMAALEELERHFSTTVRSCWLLRCGSCRHQLHVWCCVLSLLLFKTSAADPGVAVEFHRFYLIHKTLPYFKNVLSLRATFDERFALYRRVIKPRFVGSASASIARYEWCLV